MLKEIVGHDRSSRIRDGSAYLLEEILGRKKGEGEVERCSIQNRRYNYNVQSGVPGPL